MLTLVQCQAYNSIFEVISGLKIKKDKVFEEGGDSHLMKWEFIL